MDFFGVSFQVWAPLAVGGIGSAALFLQKSGSDGAKLAVHGMSELADRQKDFMADQRAEIDRLKAGLIECRSHHDGCEQRCRELETRLARLEVKDQGERQE